MNNDHEQATDLSRRALLRGGAALGLLGAAGTALGHVVPATATHARPENESLEEQGQSSRDFRSLFGLKYPIVQAALSGAGGPELAIAVAEAGGMGALALTPETPEAAERLVRQVKAGTKGAFFVNYVLRADPPSLGRALEAGAPTIQFSWGMPTAEHIRLIRAAGAKFGVQVTSSGSAKAALDLGADYLVYQGTEAGGHVQSNRRLEEVLTEVLRETKRARPGVPVLAAGGIATGGHIRRVLSRGAAAAVVGTRFVATTESRAHPDYKRALVEASSGEDTVLTTCLSKGWPNVTHRILRANPTFQMWEAAGCPPEGSRPREKDVVATAADGKPIERYRVNPPVVGMTGAVLELGTFAGESVGELKDVPGAGELMARLWREYERAKG